MLTTRPRSFRRRVAFAMLAVCGAAAHATPALEAHLGRPDELAAQILAGQIPPNAYLRLDHLASATPLCILVTNDAPSAVAATDWLLKNGADVNRDCRLNDMQYGLPLDKVAQAIAYTLSRNEPARGEFLKGQVDRLLQLGARTDQGNDTREGVAREVAYWAKLDRDHQAYIAQWLREERQKSAETFRTLIGVIGGVTAVYAISKAGSGGGSGVSQSLAAPSGGHAPSTGGLPPLLTQVTNAQRPAQAPGSSVTAPAEKAAPVGVPPSMPQLSMAGTNTAGSEKKLQALPPLLAQAAASSNRATGPATAATDTPAAAPTRWYPSLCATQDVNESGAMARSPYGYPWGRVSRAQQNSGLGRCEARDDLASRAQAAGARRLAERGAVVTDQRVVCDLGRGGYSVAVYGWVCELWAKAKLPNGKWVVDQIYESGD